MKFLVDAQLPRRLVYRLREVGHDAIHTLDLPSQNQTTDEAVSKIAHAESRVVVTKDADFVASHLLSGQPERLLLISTGNIRNVDLDALLLSNINAIVMALESSGLVELTRTTLIVH